MIYISILGVRFFEKGKVLKDKGYLHISLENG